MPKQNNNLKKQHVSEKIRTFTWLDVLLIILAISGAVSSIPLIQANQPSTVAIYKDNTLYAEYLLSEEREFSIQGHEGPMTIKIHNGHVSVSSSTCRKQICVKSGAISKPFQQLVCAPNHVLIEIRSPVKAEERIDAITR